MESLVSTLWSPDLAQVANRHDFPALLASLADHAAARRLACRKPLHDAIDSGDISNARACLEEMRKEDGITRKLPAKLQCFERLDDGPLAIVVVLCSLSALRKSAVDTFRALCQGAEKIAEWSHWPQHPELMKLVREHRPPRVVSLLTSSLFSETLHQPASLPQWQMVCRRCSTQVLLQCACNRATQSTPTSLGNTASTDAPVPQPCLPATGPIAFTRPLLVTSSPTVDGGTKLNAEAGQSKKRLRRETNPPDAATVTLRLPATTGDSSDSHTIAPSIPDQAQTSQSDGIGRPGTQANATSPLAVPPPYPNVQQGQFVPAPQSSQSTSIRHPVENFSHWMRRDCILLAHSGERLAATMKGTRGMGGNIKFERQLEDKKAYRYNTNWIAGLFRIVISNRAARDICPGGQPHFEKHSSEIMKLIASQAFYTFLYIKGCGGITVVTQDCEIHWNGPECLIWLKGSSIFQHRSLHLHLVQYIAAQSQKIGR